MNFTPFCDSAIPIVLTSNSPPDVLLQSSQDNGNAYILSNNMIPDHYMYIYIYTYIHISLWSIHILHFEYFEWFKNPGPQSRSSVTKLAPESPRFATPRRFPERPGPAGPCWEWWKRIFFPAEMLHFPVETNIFQDRFCDCGRKAPCWHRTTAVEAPYASGLPTRATGNPFPNQAEEMFGVSTPQRWI